MKIYNLSVADVKVQNSNLRLNSANYMNSPLSNKTSQVLSFPSPYLGMSQIAFKKSVLVTEDLGIPIDNSGFHLGQYEPYLPQKLGGQVISQGHDLMLPEPTGGGKTKVALFTIARNMRLGKKTIYTNPLIVLSSQNKGILEDIYDKEIDELRSTFGKKNVGIITGDLKENVDAPIVVATTEAINNYFELPVTPEAVKRNLEKQKNLGSVIIDEAQFLGEKGRGVAVESLIMKIDKRVQLVMLSGTFENSTEFANWVSRIKGRPTYVVSPPNNQRKVPLIFHLEPIPPTEGKLPFDVEKGLLLRLKAQGNVQSPENAKLAMLAFNDSRPQVKAFVSEMRVQSLMDRRYVLTTPQEQKEIQEVIDKYEKAGIYLGESLDREALLCGYASHSAGSIPTQKALVEELLQKGLLKGLAGTGTLAAGVNAPVSSVAMTSTRIPCERRFADGPDGKRLISVNDALQRLGRAGRPGFDQYGHVFLVPKNAEEIEFYKKLMAAGPQAVDSQFEIDYEMITRYFREVKDDAPMRKFLSGTFKVFGESKEESENKLKDLMSYFDAKRKILIGSGFLNTDNSLTFKGYLMSRLHGYTPIPIVDMVSKRLLSADNPVELATCVAALANADESVADRKERAKELQEQQEKQDRNKKVKGKKAKQKAKAAKQEKTTEEIKPFERSNPNLKKFMEDLRTYFDTYNSTMKSKIPNYFPVDFDKTHAEHIYQWQRINAEIFKGIKFEDLNEKDLKENFKKSWQALYSITEVNERSEMEEGSVFKEITRTSDLLRQIGAMAQEALQSKSTKHAVYYEQLGLNVQRALEHIDGVKVLFRR